MNNEKRYARFANIQAHQEEGECAESFSNCHGIYSNNKIHSLNYVIIGPTCFVQASRKSIARSAYLKLLDLNILIEL